MDETLLRKPIAEGKWSIIEIVGHFYPWDEFVLQQRIPFLFTGESLPKAPSADELNSRSSFIARRESIENTLNKCIAVRQDFINQLLQVSEEKWLSPIQIGQSILTFYEYLKGLMEHDLHHINQIKSTINTGDYSS